VISKRRPPKSLRAVRRFDEVANRLAAVDPSAELVDVGPRHPPLEATVEARPTPDTASHGGATSRPRRAGSHRQKGRRARKRIEIVAGARPRSASDTKYA
jgi:hypothetical protein